MYRRVSWAAVTLARQAYGRFGEGYYTRVNSEFKRLIDDDKALIRWVKEEVAWERVREWAMGGFCRAYQVSS